MTKEQEQTADDSLRTAENSGDLSQEQIIAASERKDQKLWDINTERNNLEAEIAEHRREANSLRKSLQDVMSHLNTLITTDIAGFLKWEKEQQLPLLELAERKANAWRNEPVAKLDVTEKDKEKLAEYFTNCGAVADWLAQDFPEKKTGLNGEKTKDSCGTRLSKSAVSSRKNPAVQRRQTAANRNRSKRFWNGSKI